MTDEQLQGFYKDFYQLLYYSNRADFSKMSYEGRRKYENWLSSEYLKILKKYEFTKCGSALMDGMFTALVNFMANKIDMECNYHGTNGVKG